MDVVIVSDVDYLAPNDCTSAATIPADTWRNDNAIFTSKLRRFYVIMTLFLRHISMGCDFTTSAFGRVEGR